MHKKLQQILEELTEISGVKFAFYESPEEYVAGTLPKEALSQELLTSMFESEEKELASEGYIGFRIRSSEQKYLLIASGAQEAVLVPGRMAANEIQLFCDAVRKSVDKNAFAAALLAGEVPTGEIYKQATRMKLKDMTRVLFLFELAVPMEDNNALRMLSSVFADGKQELLFMQDETHLVLIKAYEKGTTPDEMKKIALSAVDTMQAELMIRTRVGYSTPKETLAELVDAKREAALALKISAIFQEHKEVSAYSRLGIARLIYELPRDLCEMFLQEVFGEKMPDQDIDEETQVTIRLFFENNLNISETARRLYLHRNTLVYRLERFEKQIGLDIRRFDDAMTFQIAMMVLAHYRNM